MITEVERFISTAKIIQSLLESPSAASNDERRRVYRESITKEPAIPLNIEEDVLYGFTTVIKDRGITNRTFDYKQPYWLEAGTTYHPLDIFNATIQCFDDHHEPAPITVVPPESDVKAFHDAVMNSSGKQTVVDQFNHLLDISGNNVVGAANIGYIGARLFARGTDKRIFPGIEHSFDGMRAWNEKVAQFEVYENPDMHAGSDNYYFWTHFFVSLLTQLDDRPWARALNTSFTKGTDIMVLTRKYLVRKPTVTSHREASIIGRNIGFTVAAIIAK